jgi:nitroreductase
MVRLGNHRYAKLSCVSPAQEPPQLHALLASRWSPARFDPAHEVSRAEVESLLEAARWAPSAGNSQPWAFIVGRRGDAIHGRLVAHLAGSSASWAPGASVLVANLARRFVEGTDWEYSEFSLYDLGQAVAHMTVQAQALGLSVRQFRAFDQAAVAAEFAIPAHWEVATMAAYGRAAAGSPPPVTGSADATAPSRERRVVRELVWPVT